jgi:hypothetical protein
VIILIRFINQIKYYQFMTLDVLFLDKDNTLGRWNCASPGLFNGARDFLESQKSLGRKLYVATTGTRSSVKDIPEIASLLERYLAREDLDMKERGRLYVLPDGTMRNIYEDYVPREDFETTEVREALDQESKERADRLRKLPLDSSERAALQKEINSFFDYWGEFLHKETRVPFDPTTEYKNPYVPCLYKDLHLARRLISPLNYAEQRTLMVGDNGDASGHISDPETPLVVVSDRVRAGEWSLVTIVVNHLFSDVERTPWQRFDELYRGGRDAQEDRHPTKR